MEWQHPQALYLILPLFIAWLVIGIYSQQRRRRARHDFAAQTMWSRIFPDESTVRFWLKMILREIALVAGLVALAGPKWGVQYEQIVPRGSDLYVLIDVSRSMLADDVPPSRLGRAKADVSSLLNRLEGERVGLIAFAGQAVVKCPLTVDYDSFRRALDELDPGSAPRGGTAIGDAIRKGLEVFHGKSDRDQAMLIITDGDDQQSYPLEAAAVAAERHVTIFAVGLGDADRGARVPQKDSKSYVEYKGEQVWSKLDNSLLQQIALKTNGVYVPAGTRAYDLGELYSDHLQGRRGDDSANKQRLRRSERFQVFLAIALFALLIDLCIVPYRRQSQLASIEDYPTQTATGRSRKNRTPTKATVGWMLLLILGMTQSAIAVEPRAAVREGLKLYSSEKYDEARQKFAAAAEELDKQKSAAAAIAAFDEACAFQKRGEAEKARDAYLRAGLSQDSKIATASHFNLGNLSAEKARTLSGEKPELVEPGKRQEILDELSQAVTAYRHCLELQPSHPQARRNLELVRQWIKYYTDQWRERDRQKRRDETNVLQFLEFLIQTQTALRETVNQLPVNVHADVLAEIKRAQEELREEIPTLREKIANELRPKPDPQAPANNTNSKELDEAIALLREWADDSGRHMSTAARRLDEKQVSDAASEQQSAIDELDKIWEAVVPFHSLLSRLLADQTSIARSLNPEPAEQPNDEQNDNKQRPSEEDEPNDPAVPRKLPPSTAVEIDKDDLEQQKDAQSRTLKRTRQLAPKAQMELQRLEEAPPKEDSESEKPDDAQNGPPQQSADPEKLKEGYLKAIELAPQAVQKMESAVEALRQRNRQEAGQHAEEARKILEQIKEAQPKSDQQQDQQDKDQQNQDQQKKDDQKEQDQKDGEQKNKDDQKNEEKQDQKQDQQKKDSQSQNPQKQQAQVSKDRMEDALRKVRERQQEKRERDKKLKALLLGRSPVDKDW